MHPVRLPAVPALVLAAIALLLATTDGEARGRSGGGHRSAGHAVARSVHAPAVRHSHRRVHSRPSFYAVPRYYGVPRTYDDCGWLYRRAVSTGSPTWWRRYRICVGS